MNSNFLPWFASSDVLDRLGMPLVVYRGEHGPIDCSVRFQTRLGSISFGSQRAARYYALQPNCFTDQVVVPRLFSAFLSIQRPVVNSPNDPFVEFSELGIAIGFEKASQIALRLAGHIENTNNWVDDIGNRYVSVAEFLTADPGALKHLYVDAYAVFDEIDFVSWFLSAGFDGAIHGGSGVTAGESEYKIFSESQAYSDGIADKL